MAGLNLGVGARGYIGAGSLPDAANSPTGTTIAQKAFGITASADSAGARAANGTLIIGAAATVLLAWLWWTLPR